MANIKIQFSSVGGAAVEAAFQSIIKGASATSQQIVALSQTLNTTAKGAATFASNIGLSVGEVTRVTNSFNALRSQGLSLSETFKILQRETGINASQYKALVTQLKSAEDQTNAYVKSLKDQEDAQQATSEASAAQILALQQVNQAAQQVSQALKAFTGQAVGAFIEYDGALTTLRAKAQPTTEEMEKLEAAILDVALVTSQTPTSAAKAATSFISVGASASSAAENLKTAAQLTDAFQGDFTVAAKVVQLGANIFKDFGETAQSVGDKLTYISNTTAAGSTNGLDEYLQLFSKSAPLARELGIGLDELVASFGVLRDAGQAPEVAATSLKSLLSTVIDNTDKFKELGIEVFDSNGKFIGLTETFKRIAETQSGVSSGLELAGSELAELSAQSTEAGLSIEQVNDIFGKIGVSSALTLANGYEKVAEKTGLVSEQFGTLSKQAEVVNSSIQGQISLLQGSFESALVDIGKSLSGVTAPAVGGMLQLINVFLAADPVIKNFVGVSLGVATAAAGVVAALTGFALTLKALEVAQVGTTLKVIAATGANTANAVSAVAAGIANQGLARSLGIVAVAAINAAQGVTTAAVAAGKSALAFAPLVIAMGGVVAAGKLVQASVDSSTSANRAKGAIDGLNKALEDYNKVAGVTIPEAEKTKSRFDQLKDGLKELGSELIFRAENFKAFGIGTSAAEAGANSLTIATANMQPALSALNNEFLGFKQAGELGGDTAQALIPALEAAKAAIGSLQAEGAKNINTTAAQTDQWRIEQVALTKMIDELKGAAVATTTLGHANKETTKTYQELVDALANTTGAIETELLNAQAEAYAELGDNKEALEQRLFEIEQDSLEQRLAKQIQFLKDINTATFESDTEKNAKIGEAEEAIASLRLEINKNASDRLIEQEEESLKLREEAEKAFAEKQEALAKQAYDRKKILLDQETNDLNQALDDRIAAENAAIEVLNDRSDLLNQELNLLNLLGDQSALIYAGREQDLNRQIEALGQQNQTIDQQIEKLKQTGASQSEIAALEERKILNANNILVLEEAKRVAAEEQLKVQQAIEQQQLLYQQELTRLDLDRQVRQAQINAIESEREVIQARQLAKSNELELSEQRRLFNLAKINGASEAEIIALQGQIDAATATLALSQESVGLAQQAAQLSKDEVTDAELARAKYEEISQVEAENLRLKQANERAQLANTNEASRTADQLARGAQEADELASSADGAASAIGGAADQGDRLTGSLGQARQEAGLLEQSLVAAGRALSDFQKQQLAQSLPNQTFDSSGKNTTLAKREIGGLGTQYFVGGKEVSESEYNAARKAEQDSKKTTRTYVTGANVTPEFFGDNPTSDSLNEFIRNSERFVSAVDKVRSSRGRIQATEYVYQQAAANELAKELLPAILKQEAESLRNQEKKILGIELETAKIREQYAEVEKLDTLENENIVSRDRLTKLQLEDNAKDLEAARLALNNATIQQVNSNDAVAVQNREEAIVASENRIAELRLAKVKIISDALVALGYDINSSVPILTQSIQSRAGGGTLRIGGTAIEGRAVGGDVKRNQPYIVGERGRELFIPNQSGTIVPNSLLTAPTLPGSYSLSPTASTGGADSRALVLEIQGLRRDLANRPVPAVESNVTFVNEPNPLEAQIRLLQGQLRAGRSL